MNCAEVEVSLTEVARDTDANPALRKQALLHARSCSRCGARLEREQGLNDLLDALSVEMQREAAPSATETALLAEFRRRQEGPAPIPVVIPKQAFLSRWLVAAAAILLVFALGVLALKFSPSRHQPTGGDLAGGSPATTTPAPPSPGKNEIDKPAVSSELEAPHKIKRPRRFYNAVTRNVSDEQFDPNASEVATEFFPINGFSDWSDVDSGQVLRVKLPRTALMSFGLPIIDPNREDQRVTADVLLTSDGVARAIRFVR